MLFVEPAAVKNAHIAFVKEQTITELATNVIYAIALKQP